MGMKTRRRRTEWMYMHTLDGRPAFYRDGTQVYFALADGPFLQEWLVPTLGQLKREQAASDAWRKEQGYTLGICRYGYQRVAADFARHPEDA